LPVEFLLPESISAAMRRKSACVFTRSSCVALRPLPMFWRLAGLVALATHVQSVEVSPILYLGTCQYVCHHSAIFSV
jgi:hypothetical protein